MPFSTTALLSLLMSPIYCKKTEFFAKNGTFTQSNTLRPELEIFSSVLNFCKIIVRTGESQEYQILHECPPKNVTECCKIPRLQLLSFASY